MKFLLGREPYMPLEANRPEFSRWVQGQEKVLNELAVEGGFYEEMIDVFGFTLGFGQGYMEERWELGVTSVMQRMPIVDPVLGVVKGYDESLEPKVTETLRYIARGPWEVLPHPFGTTLDQKPFIVIKELAHVNEIKRLLDKGKPFRLPDGVSEKDLKEGPSHKGSEEWVNQWRRDRGIMTDDAGEGVGVLCRAYFNPTEEYPRGRWAYVWNYWIPLFDEENLNENMRPEVKPVQAFRDITHIGPDRFFGQGLFEQTEDKVNLADDLRSIYVNELLLRQEGILLYDPNAVDVENLDTFIGGRIPILNGFSKPMDQAVMEIPRSPVDDNLMATAQELDNKTDNDLKINAYQTGESPPRKETLGVSRMLSEAGDANLEMKTRVIEMGPFKRMGLYSVKLVAAHASPETVISILGEEEAQHVLSLDPESVPGGFKFKFQGSTSVTRKGEEAEAFEKWFNLAMNDPEMQARHIPRRKYAMQTEQFTQEEAERMYPDPDEQGYGPDTNAPPPEQLESVGQEGAIMNPNQITTPATNAAAGSGV